MGVFTRPSADSGNMCVKRCSDGVDGLTIVGVYVYVDLDPGDVTGWVRCDSLWFGETASVSAGLLVVWDASCVAVCEVPGDVLSCEVWMALRPGGACTVHVEFLSSGADCPSVSAVVYWCVLGD